MSIFGSILSKIFGHRQSPEASPSPEVQAPAAPSSGDVTWQPTAVPTADASQSTATPVDVEAVLTQMASNNPQQLNWRQSIVDLMKLLNLDSSLQARKELANELGYSGDTGDSAAMNIWLHKQVMRKLAENGGRVPDELRT